MSDHDILLEIRELLMGKGTAENPGLVTRVDRMEQRGALYTWAASTGVAAVVSLIVAWATAKFGSKP